MANGPGLPNLWREGRIYGKIPVGLGHSENIIQRILRKSHRCFIIRSMEYAPVKDGLIVGFGDIDDTGYLDRLFVHRDYRGQKIAAVLCDRLEAGFPAGPPGAVSETLRSVD